MRWGMKGKPKTGNNRLSHCPSTKELDYDTVSECKNPSINKCVLFVDSNF